MPIIDVEVVDWEMPRADGHHAREIADAAAEILEAEKGETWVRLRRLPAEDYAENGVDLPPRPVFVSLLVADPDDLPPSVPSKLAVEIGRICNRPADLVHIRLESAPNNTIFFGGQRR